MNNGRFFTPTEANETLPLVKGIVVDILSLGRRLRVLATELGEKFHHDPDVVELMTELQELFSELEGIGCSYRDWNFDVGLVDFPY